MKFNEAIGILEMYPDSTDTDQGLARAYRSAMRKYHPDVTELDPNFALEMSKLVNEAYTFLHENMGKWSVDGNANIPNIVGMMAEIYNKIKHIPNIKIERLGVWLWVTVEKPEEFRYMKSDTLEEKLVKRDDFEKYRKEIGKRLEEHGFKYAPKKPPTKRKWSWHDESSSPSKFKKKAWDWDRIKNTFDHDELETEPLTAVG